MTKSITLTDEEVASMLTRAFYEGFNFSREGFNGECAFDHLAPDGLTLEEKSAITVREILADHDAKLMTKEIEPIAWHVSDKNGQVWACVESEDEALQIARDFSNTDDNHMVYSSFPVYRQITLTDKEIEAIDWAELAAIVEAANETSPDQIQLWQKRATILRNLLERTKDK
jgi:hypothetical protein